MTDPRVPLTLVTGFLGAGKTTLLNRVLNDSSTGRAAVIVNEFGDAGLDHDLIEGVPDEDVTLMQSGCLCCSLRGDLARVITSLAMRRHRGELEFERMVIETTGLADPGPVLQTLTADSLIARLVRLDGVVTLADAANGPATLDAHFEAVQQAAMADLIVTSKTDLVTPEAASAFQTRLASINPGARIITATQGAVDPADLWGLTGMRHEATPAAALAWTAGPEAAKPGAGGDPFANLSGLGGWTGAAGPATAQFGHDARIGAASVEVEAPIPDAAFDLWLDTLVRLLGPDLLRVKGVVFLTGMETPFVFHGVQHVFDPPVPLKHWPEGDRRSRIVVIARDATRAELERAFDLLRARPADPEGAR